MPVLKNKTQGRFVLVNRNIVEDKELRLADRGLLLTLLSLPDNWDFSIKGMTYILHEGKAAVSASFDRLMKRGYVRKRQLRNESGQFAETAIEVFDKPFKPFTEKRFTDKRVAGKPVTGNRAQLNTKELSNKEVSNNRINKAYKERAGKEKHGAVRSDYTNEAGNGSSCDGRSSEIDLYGFPVSDM